MPKFGHLSIDGYESECGEDIKPEVIPHLAVAKAKAALLSVDIEDCAITVAAPARVEIPPQPEKKTGAQIFERAADLSICPKPLQVDADHKHISLGDLHGNAMKLIYTLIEEGFLELSEKNYDILNHIYESEPDELDTHDLYIFKSILDSAKVNNDKAITLIGDELADRGNNDWFMLLLLKKLHEAHVNVEVLISNHSVEFIRKLSGISASIDHSVTRSYANMEIFVAKGVIGKKDIYDIFTNHYIPMVKALSYSISNKEEMTIYSHAPIGLETIEAIALKLKVDYDETTKASLMRTIDNINKKIKELFISGEFVTILKLEGDAAFVAKVINANVPIPIEYPLMRLVWNRDLGSELRIKSKDGSFEIKDVHGHIGKMPIMAEDGLPSPSHQNLDNNFGKSSDARIARVGSPINHFTRRSPDTYEYSLKYQLSVILAEIKDAKIDHTLDAVIAEQEILLSNTDDKDRLLEIKVILERLHNDLFELSYLKSKCLEVLRKIKDYKDFETRPFVKHYTEVVLNTKDKTELKEIRKTLDNSMYRLLLTAILDKIEIYPLRGMKKFVERYIDKINNAYTEEALDKIKDELDSTLSKIVFLYNIKRTLNQVLTDILKFKGMESYVSEQKLAISKTMDKDVLQQINKVIKEKLSNLVMNDTRAKVRAMIDEIKVLYKKNKAYEDIDSWVEKQRKIVDDAPDITALEQINCRIEKQLTGLYIRDKIKELKTKALAMLAEFKIEEFVEEQQLAIKSLLQKVAPQFEDSCLNEVEIGMIKIIAVIEERKAVIDLHELSEPTSGFCRM